MTKRASRPKVRSRAKARRKACNDREYRLFSRDRIDCTLCPPNHNENHHGHHPKWGRKVASRRVYTQGKCRSEAWREKGWWDLIDNRYFINK